MLKLAALSLDGFKSFPERTEVKFGPGVTAIVGPNGGGKSNLLDGVHFALAETAGSRMRAERFEHLIYRGPRGERSMAQVELKVRPEDEGGGMLEEVELARRLYPDGGTEALIDGSGVRLKDVDRFLAPHNLGTTGVFSIGQGEVEKQLLAAPSELRKFFDEATGIALLLKQLARAERKLDRAREHRDKLEEDLGDAREREAELRTERIEAELAGFLRGMTVRLERERLTRRKSSLESEIDDLEKEREHLAGEERGRREALAAAEQQLEELREELEDASQEREESLRRLSELGKALERRQSQIREKRSELQNLKQRREELGKEHETLEHNREVIERELGDTEEERAELTEKLEAAREKRRESAAKVDELEQRAGDRRERSGELEQALEEKRERLRETGSELQQIESSRESAREARGKLGERAERLSERLEELEKRQEELEQRDERLAEKLAAVREEETDLAERREELEEEISGLDERLSELREGRASLEARRESLEERAERAEGSSELKQKLLREGAEDPLDGLRLSDEELELLGLPLLALRNAVQTEGEAPETPDTEEVQGWVVFQVGNEDRQAPAEPDDLLAELGLPRPVERLLRRRFGEIRVVSGGLERLVDAAGGETSALAEDGGLFVSRSGLAWAGSPEPASRELLARAGKLEEIGERLAGLEDELSSAAGRRAELQEAKQQCGEELETKRERLNELERERAQLEQKHSETGERRAEVEQELAGINEENAELAERLEELAGREEELEEERETLRERAGQDAEALQQAAEDLEELEERLETARDELGERRERERELASEVRIVEERMEIYQKQRGQLEERRERLADQRKETAEKRERLQEELEELTAEPGPEAGEMESLEKRIDGLDERRDELREKVGEQEETVEAAREELERAREQLEAVEKRLAQREGRLEALQESAAEEEDDEPEATVLGEWPAPDELPALDELLEKFGEPFEGENAVVQRLTGDRDLTQIEELSDGELKRWLSTARERRSAIGEVNELAGNQHRGAVERLEFLASEFSEAEESLQNLAEAARELKRNTSEKFTENLAEIDAEFDRLLKRVFNERAGGSVELEEPEQPLESNVTVEVGLPGKRLQTLQELSGGERSLIFIALFLAANSVLPSGFVVLDEVDTALDESNVVKFAKLMREFSDLLQFIVITHNKATMEFADRLIGVVSGSDGASQVVPVDLEEARELADERATAAG